MTDTKQVERLIEINEDFATAKRLADTLRDPSKGMHAQPVENGKCWNVRLVINP